VVECLPNKHEALSSNHRKEERKKGRKKGRKERKEEGKGRTTFGDC
jgi:hypothetical protein